MYIYKQKEHILYIDIILFAIIAAVLATNLYRVLGKRTVSEKKTFKSKAMENEIKDSIFSEQVMEYSQKQILDLDKNFESFLSWILNLRKDLAIPHKLSDIMDCSKLDLNKLSIMALEDPSTSGNPKKINQEDLKLMYQHSISGELFE